MELVPEPLIKRVRISAGILVLLYAAGFLILYFFQKSFIYIPTKQDFNACPEFNSAQKLSENGTRFYYKSVSDKLVVFYHGQVGAACDRAFLAPWFESAGYSYAFVEYAGYSNDTRTPDAELIRNDVRNIEDFIKSVHPSVLVIAGESLGSGPASYEASLEPDAKLLLISPFTSLFEISQRKLPIFPISWMLKENFDNVASLGLFRGQLLVLTGTLDLIVPPSFSERLFESAPTVNKSLVVVPGAGHVDDVYTFSQTKEAVQHFLAN